MSKNKSSAAAERVSPKTTEKRQKKRLSKKKLNLEISNSSAQESVEVINPIRRRQIMEREFSIGEKAVYPAQGVAEVVGIEEKSISGAKIRFYVLKILDTEMKIMVPTQKAEQVGLRKLASTGDIKKVMQILEDTEVQMDKQTWNRRYRGFMEKIKTGSLFDVAEVYRDLSRLKSGKTLSFGEKRMLDTARGLIVKELAIAQDKNEEKIESKLEQMFN